MKNECERARRQRAQTKIVATVGPACREEAQLAALIDAGVDVFRLNMAHGAIAQHEEVLNRIRKISAEKRHPVGVLVDLAGPKIRLGEIAGGSFECEIAKNLASCAGKTPTTPGDSPAITRCSSTRSRSAIESCWRRHRVYAGGRKIARRRPLPMRAGRAHSQSPRRESAGRQVSLPAMSDDDKEHATWAATHGIDYVSLSFVRSPKEVHELKWLLGYHRSQARA